MEKKIYDILWKQFGPLCRHLSPEEEGRLDWLVTELARLLKQADLCLESGAMTDFLEGFGG